MSKGDGSSGSSDAVVDYGREHSSPGRGDEPAYERSLVGGSADTPPEGRGVARMIAGAGCALILVSLFATWGYDESFQPTVALNAWEAYSRSDLVLGLLATLGFGGAFIRHRAGAFVTFACAAAIAILVLRLMARSDPAWGAGLALLACSVALVGAVLRVIAADRYARLLGRAGDIVWPVLETAADVVPRGLRPVLSTWFLGPVIALVTFPVHSFEVGGGTDGSWVTALYVATHQQLDFGTQVIFTYGPLGFLTVPRLYYPEMALAGFAYEAIVQVGLALAVLWAARRSFALPVAVLIAVIVSDGLKLMSDVSVAVIMVVACIAVLRDERWEASRWWPAFLATAGAVAAMHVLVKLTTGLLLTLLVGIVAVGCARKGRRLISVGVATSAFAVTLAILWLALGQAVGALPEYVFRSYEVIVGFPESSYTEEQGRQWEYFGAALMFVVVGAGLLTAAAPLFGWRRFGLCLIVAVYSYSWFKQGFVRHDAHSIGFFAAMLGLAIAIGWPRRPILAAYLGAAAVMLGFFAAAKPIPWEFHRPSETRASLSAELDLLRDPDTFISQQRTALREQEALDRRTLTLIRGRTTDIFPTEAAVAWAYPEIRWDPRPVFQGYVAYTDDLDRVNADALAGSGAPERILRTPEYSPFENPGAARELFCRYRQLSAGERWQVLARAPNRCGPMRSIGTVNAVVGQEISIPRAGGRDAVLVAIHGLGVSGLERLRSLVWKPYDRALLLDRNRPRRVNVQLADNPSFVWIPPAVDFRRPFGMADQAELLQVVVQTEGVFSPLQAVARPVRVEFFAMSVREPAVVGDG